MRLKGGVEQIEAEAIAVGTSAVVWADTTSGRAAELTTEFVDAFLFDFEDHILPRARDAFGRESDIDDNGLLELLFTPLTREVAVAFFSGCDLHTADSCAHSNEAEVLYLTPPGAIRPPYNTPRAMKEILAHELEHLIHHHHKVLRNNLREDPEAMYLLEGFGALAQDVTGYQAGNLYVTRAGLEQIDELSLIPLLQTGASYDEERDGALRGGAYLLVRWLYDRAGGDRAVGVGIVDTGGPTLLSRLLDSPEPIPAALAALTSRSLEDVAMDFYTTLGMSREGSTTPAPTAASCFAYAPAAEDPVTGKQRGADVFARFHGQQMRGAATQPLGAADGSLRTGGVELLTISGDPKSSQTAFTLTVDERANARVRVGRLR